MKELTYHEIQAVSGGDLNLFVFSATMLSIVVSATLLCNYFNYTDTPPKYNPYPNPNPNPVARPPVKKNIFPPPMSD